MKGATKEIISQEGGLLTNVLGASIRVSLLLIKNVFTPLAKDILIPLALIAAVSTTDAAIQEKKYGSYHRNS